MINLVVAFGASGGAGEVWIVPVDADAAGRIGIAGETIIEIVRAEIASVGIGTQEPEVTTLGTYHLVTSDAIRRNFLARLADVVLVEKVEIIGGPDGTVEATAVDHQERRLAVEAVSGIGTGRALADGARTTHALTVGVQEEGSIAE
jgi:hypothetical protein